MNDTTPTCPKCGSPDINHSSGVTIFSCEDMNDVGGVQTELCKQRQRKRLFDTAHAARAFVDFCDENLGPNADWPMKVSFDDDGSGKLDEFCRLLNNLKAQIHPAACRQRQ